MLYQRKTFYTHYETIDILISKILDQVADEYIQEFSSLPDGRPHEDANRVFFTFFSGQPEWVQKILCYEPYEYLSNIVFDKAYDYAFEHNAYNPMRNLPQSVRNMIKTFYRSTTLDLYRQWMKDGRKLTLDEVIAVSSELICHGENGTVNISAMYKH